MKGDDPLGGSRHSATIPEECKLVWKYDLRNEGTQQII